MTEIGVVERTPYGDFVKEWPAIRRGWHGGFPTEYYESGTTVIITRFLLDGAWQDTGNPIVPVTRCLTPVRERRRRLRAMGRL